MSTERESEIVAAFVTLSTRLAHGYDVADLLTELAADCTHLLDVASSGLLLADPRGVLHVLAASSERTRQLEVFQIQREEGPCLDCYRTGEPQAAPDLRLLRERWPVFVPAAEAAGFASVHTVPLRLRNEILGALGLFNTEAGAMSEDDLALAQALADVASVAIVNENAVADRDTLNDQLQRALQSRVVIEQAKGVLAQLSGLDMAAAFDALRSYARTHRLRLSDVAGDVVHRRLSGADVVGTAAPDGAR